MSVFSDLKPRNTVSRNGFDLSRRCVFSSKAGTIKPVFVQPTLPNSRYRINVNQLMRTQPLQTAAYSGASINYDFVFVPLNHLYSSFNQFIGQRQNKNLVYQPSNTRVPRFDLGSFLGYILPLAIYEYLCSSFGSVDEFYAEVNRQKPGFYHNSNIPSPFIDTLPHDPNQGLYLDIVSQLDMFGYGNFLPLVKTWASAFISYEGYTDLGDLVSFITSNYDASKSLRYQRYVNIIEIIIDDVNGSSDVGGKNFNYFIPSGIYPNLWPALAYNKAFYEYYRSSYYDLDFEAAEYFRQSNESGRISYDYVQLFNFDDWNDNFVESCDEFECRRLCAIFCSKNHLYKRDLFTGVLPSTQFGDVEVMVDNRDWMKLIVSNNGDRSSNLVVTSNTSSVSISGATSNYPRSDFRFDPALAISVLESRRADAMQRFKERMMRAGDKTKDIFKAHGWNEPKSESSFEPVFLGSFDGRLDLNVVAATTSVADGQDLGQLASNGTAVVNGSEIDFNCSDFGVIIGLCYILKDAEYDSYGLERHLQLTEPFDYPYPELQNISLGPIVRGEMINYGDGQADEAKFNHVLGYLPRFMEYKTALDKVHGEFYSANPFVDHDFPTRNLFDVVRGVFSDWVSPRQHYTDMTSKQFLYMSNSVFDNIFYQSANQLQETDQFLFNAYFKCTAIEPLSVIGLPI